MWAFAAWGLNFQSELALDGYPCVQGEANPDLVDVRISRSTHLVALQDPVDSGACFQVKAREFYVEVPKRVRFMVKNGASIEFWSSPENEALVPLFLSHSPLVALLQQRQNLVLRGSAVMGPRGAALVLGGPATGKSFVAGWLSARGALVLTDDICAVNPDSCVLHPGPPFLDLWKDARQQLGLRKGWPVGEKPDCLRVPVDSKCESVPVDKIFVIELRNDQGVVVEKVEGPKKLQLLLLGTYFPHLLAGQDLSRFHLSAIARLATKVPVYRIGRPAGLDTIEEICESINRLLKP